MASKPRDFNPQLCYHIYNRCVAEKQKIFRSDKDYQRFFDTLLYYCLDRPLPYAQFQRLSDSTRDLLFTNPKGLQTKRVKLLAYVIMPNHFHILVRPINPADLSRFVSDVTNSYTRYFNKKYGRGGALFQGPFKSKAIADDSSLLQVSRYIHLNPINSKKANPKGLLRKPQDYRYSSYFEWAGFKQAHTVDVDEVSNWVKQVGGTDGYRDFVEAKLGRDPALGIEDLIIEP